MSFREPYNVIAVVHRFLGRGVGRKSGKVVALFRSVRASRHYYLGATTRR